MAIRPVLTLNQTLFLGNTMGLLPEYTLVKTHGLKAFVELVSMRRWLDRDPCAHRLATWQGSGSRLAQVDK